MQHNPQHLHALSSQPCLSREFNMPLSLNLRERLWLGLWFWHATPVARGRRGMARAVPRSSRGAGTGADWRCRASGKVGMALAL